MNVFKVNSLVGVLVEVLRWVAASAQLFSALASTSDVGMETVLSTPPWDQMFGKSAEKVPVMQGWDKESRIIFMTLIIELGVSSFMCGY